MNDNTVYRVYHQPESLKIEDWVELFTWHEKASMTWRSFYDRFRQTAIWAAIKEKAIIQAGGKCKKCQSNERPLDVYHIKYERMGGLELPEDLEVLCYDCRGGTDDPVNPELEQERLTHKFAERVDRYATNIMILDGWGEGWRERHTMEEAELEFLLARYESYCRESHIRFTPENIDPKDFEEVSQMVRDNKDIWEGGRFL